MKEKLVPCPVCGNTDVGVKDNIVETFVKDNPGHCVRSIWAYCRKCGHETRKVKTEVPDNDDELVISTGYNLWNGIY